MTNKQTLRQLKILIVEDESKLLNLLKDALRNYFASVITAKNGKEGYTKFLKNSPDIVITDIMMPKIDGLTMSQEIKSINPQTPIIVLSAFGNQDKLLKAIEIGISKYFIKPFDVDDLLTYLSLLSQKIHEQKTIKLIYPFSFKNSSKTLYKKNLLVKLTKREKHFLELLLRSDNYTLSFEHMTQKLWDNEVVHINTVRTFIKRFRVKTSKDLVSNVSGQGYILNLSKNNI